MVIGSKVESMAIIVYYTWLKEARLNQWQYSCTTFGYKKQGSINDKPLVLLVVIRSKVESMARLLYYMWL